jgi:2-iminobutanoate/2-iminopropanoate deaminase
VSRAAGLAALLLASLACALARDAAGPRRVVVEGVGRLPAFAHATVAGDLIFVSGMLGTKPGSTELVDGGVGPQTRQALRNVEAILAAEGATLRDVAKCTVYLADMADYAAMNEAYAPLFEGSPPARATIAAGGLALDAALELDCIAQRPAARRDD